MGDPSDNRYVIQSIGTRPPVNSRDKTKPDKTRQVGHKGATKFGLYRML
jgi:hypothetical protein